MSEKKLYMIINSGCDDATIGMQELTETEYQVLKSVFDNLNKKSTYGCMPTIHITDDLEELKKPSEYGAEHQGKWYTSRRLWDL